jgi:hypothetical protein
MVAYAMTLLLQLFSDRPELTADPDLRRALWSLLAEARYGQSAFEEAAFVVRDADGRHAIVRWPRANVQRQAWWKGAFPPGTVAIVHTHRNASPEPSEVDALAARRRGLPVYVLTLTQITRTLGGESEVVVQGNWRPVSEERRHPGGRTAAFQAAVLSRDH